MGLYNRDYGRSGDGFGGSTFGGASTPYDRIERPRSAAITLIVVTCVIWLISTIVGDAAAGENPGRNPFIEWFGLYGETLYKPWLWWQFVSYGFLHDTNDIMHLAGNMIGLFFFGRYIEQRLGRDEFLRFYFVTLAVAGLAGAVFYVAQGFPGATVGASGAVMALTILFACYERHANILLFFVLPVPAWLVAIGFTVFNLLGAVQSLTNPGASNTAFMVHLGGIGFALAYYKWSLNLKFLTPDGLADLPARWRDRSRRAKLKVHDPDRNSRRTAEAADAVLEKISLHGEESLTASERKILQRYSRDQRRRQQSRS